MNSERKKMQIEVLNVVNCSHSDHKYAGNYTSLTTVKNKILPKMAEATLRKRLQGYFWI
jgi:hypothetical protein